MNGVLEAQRPIVKAARGVKGTKGTKIDPESMSIDVKTPRFTYKRLTHS
jgi:hypothetical protein